MRKLLLALLAAALLFPVIASPVSGAGTCSRAYIRFWSGSNGTGSSAKYCWTGVNTGDANYRSYVSGVPNMGPLWDDTYRYDFDPSDFLSGVNSITFYGNPNDGLASYACIYYSKNFETPATRVYAGGTYNITADTGSFKWTQVASVNDC